MQKYQLISGCTSLRCESLLCPICVLESENNALESHASKRRNSMENKNTIYEDSAPENYL